MEVCFPFAIVSVASLSRSRYMLQSIAAVKVRLPLQLSTFSTHCRITRSSWKPYTAVASAVKFFSFEVALCRCELVNALFRVIFKNCMYAAVDGDIGFFSCGSELD